MVQASKTFRIFVSSTFSDLKEERNALQREVFPKLRELCAQHGCRFQAIDLRWGVSEEAGLDQQTMKICLEEIERSQKVSPKPNFIVLLVDRYGWRPLPYEIPSDEFEEIKQIISDDEKDFLFWEGEKLDDEQLKKPEGWYCRDENALPPVYCLKPRTVEYQDNASDEEIIESKEKEANNWYQIENKLKSILLNAIYKLGWVEDDPRRFKYESSATEQEIIQGVLNAPDFVPDPEEHVFAFFRNMDETDEIQFDDDSKDYLDFNEYGTQDESSKRRLTSLKKKISNKLPLTNVFNYNAEWENNKVTTNHFNDLCRDVYNSLETILLEQIKEFEEKDALDQEIEAHKEFGKDRSRLFIGRENNRDKIKSYVENPNSKPMVVYGDSGSGKSALMAKIIKELYPNFYKKDELYDDGVIIRFIGATPDSSDIRSLLASLCREITKKYGVDDPNIPSEYNKLVNDFKERLKLANPEKPLFIFLDALDQLSDSNAHNLTWLPDELPENVHVVISTLKEPFQSSIENRIPEENSNEVKPLEENEGQLILESWLKDMTIKRKLTPEQENEVINKFNENGLPLYLKLAFEEARRWKSYTFTPILESDIPGIIRQMFESLSKPENHGKILVSHSLGYLSAAKNGLSEDEMLDILALDEKVFILTKKFHEPTEEKLPVALWSRLYFDLEPYLTERSADGTTLLAFYHRQLGEVAQEEFLDEKVKRDRHRLIANYFQNQNLSFENGDERVYNVRKVSELAYQETYGEIIEDLENTLTDLLFIEAKFSVGMGYDLLADYKRVGATQKVGPPIITLNYYDGKYGAFCPFCQATSNINKEALGTTIKCPECKKKLKINPFFVNAEWNPSKKTNEITAEHGYELNISESVFEFAYFIQSQMHILDTHPELTFQQAINQSDDTIVSFIAKNVAKKGYNKTWIEWENKTNEKIPLLMTLKGHTKDVESCVVSNDGKRIASASRDNSVRVWDAESGKILTTLSGHTDYVNSCAFSPDGKRIASASHDKSVRVWDAETGKILIVFFGHMDLVSNCNFSPDGKKIVSASWDKSVRIWDVETGKELYKYTGHKNWVNSCTFSPDGKRIASASNNEPVRVWESETRKEQTILSGHKDNVLFCTFSPDGKKIVSASLDKTARVWNAKTGKELKILSCAESVRSSVFSPDGKQIATTSNDGSVRVWDVETGKEMNKFISHTNWVNSCAFFPDGKRIASASNDGSVRVWDAELRVKQYAPTVLTEWVGHCVFSPNGKWLAMPVKDESVRIWDSGKGVEVKILKGHKDWIFSCAFSPCSNKIISASNDYSIKIWSTELGKELRTLTCHDGVESCAFSPDGKRIASACRDKLVYIWDSETGKLIKILKGHTGPVRYCIFSPDGKQIVSTSDDGSVRIWDVETGRVVKISKHNKSVYFCVFSPDGKQIASASNDNYARICDVETGKIINCISFTPDKEISICDFSPDGKRISLASKDDKVYIWDFETEKVFSKLCVYFCGEFYNGGQIISRSGDNSISIFDAETKKELNKFLTNGIIQFLSVSGQGEIAIGDNGGSVYILNVQGADVNIPVITPVRLYLFDEHNWDDDISAKCKFCGERIKVQDDIIDAIEKLKKQYKKPDGWITDEAWKDPRLITECPHCHNKLRFNPFIVDNKKTKKSRWKFWNN